MHANDEASMRQLRATYHGLMSEVDRNIGRLEPGVFAALGYCGAGLPRGTALGKLLVEYAMGSESDLIAEVQALSEPRTLPPQPFLGLGSQARLAWYRRQIRAGR